MKSRGNSFLKIIDKYIGIPLLFFLSLVRQKQPLSNNHKFIGILATAALGDTILLSALGKTIKLQYPESEVTIFASESNAAIVNILEGFDRLVFVPIKNPLKSIRILRKNKIDLLIDSGQWARINSLLTLFSGASQTIGFQTKGQYRHFCYDLTISHNDSIHELENFLNLASPLGNITRSLPEFKKNQRIEKVNNRIVCHIKPSGEKSWMKEWDTQKWITLIDYFNNKGYLVFLTGSQEDREDLIKLHNKLQNMTKVIVVAGKFTLKQTQELLESCKLCVSVNTGIMHMASILNVNLVAIHGPTNPKRWGPLNQNSSIVESSLNCSPCLNLGFDYKCPVNECMKSITLDMVLEACKPYLS
jgi:heptosyltransferase-3